MVRISFLLLRNQTLAVLFGVYLLLCIFRFRGDLQIFKYDSQADSFVSQSRWISGVLMESSGGLGNQMFRFACAYSLAHEYGVPLYLHCDENLYDHTRGARLTNSSAREFVLDKFNIPDIPIITSEELRMRPKIRITDEEMLFKTYHQDESDWNTPFLLYHSGYCQNEAYFIKHKKIIQRMFTPKEHSEAIKPWLDLIETQDKPSVCVHIRWGDYAELPGWITPMTYYIDATTRIKMMLKTTAKFLIFSDSIDFVQNVLTNNMEFLQLTADDDVYFVKRQQGFQALTNYEEFLLMSSCNHNIIPNSSFGWWAAYLNRNSNKIVMAANFNSTTVKTLIERDENFNKLIYVKHRYPNDWITYDP